MFTLNNLCGCRFQNGTNLYFKEVNKELDDDKFQCIATNIISGEEYESISAQFNITCKLFAY